MVRLEACPRDRLWGHLMWFLLWFGVTCAALLVTPDPRGHGTHQQLGLPPCPSILLWGRPCPGCGLTTSFSAVLHGDWGLAMAAHPAGPLLYAAFTVSALACLAGFASGRRVDAQSRGFNNLLLSAIVALVAYGAARFFGLIGR